jgi:hypothetical protein
MLHRCCTAGVSTVGASSLATVWAGLRGCSDGRCGFTQCTSVTSRRAPRYERGRDFVAARARGRAAGVLTLDVHVAVYVGMQVGCPAALTCPVVTLTPLISALAVCDAYAQLLLARKCDGERVNVREGSGGHVDGDGDGLGLGHCRSRGCAVAHVDIVQSATTPTTTRCVIVNIYLGSHSLCSVLRT